MDFRLRGNDKSKTGMTNANATGSDDAILCDLCERLEISTSISFFAASGTQQSGGFVAFGDNRCAQRREALKIANCQRGLNDWRGHGQ